MLYLIVFYFVKRKLNMFNNVRVIGKNAKKHFFVHIIVSQGKSYMAEGQNYPVKNVINNFNSCEASVTR